MVKKINPMKTGTGDLPGRLRPSLASLACDLDLKTQILCVDKFRGGLTFVKTSAMTLFYAEHNVHEFEAMFLDAGKIKAMLKTMFLTVHG